MDRLSDLEKVEKAKGELGLKYKVKKYEGCYNAVE